jgi:hypothetical protein
MRTRSEKSVLPQFFALRRAFQHDDGQMSPACMETHLKPYNCTGIARNCHPGRARKPNIKEIPKGFEKNLLCGVADSESKGVGLAILREFDFRGNKISLLTPVPREKIKVVQPGDLYLSRDGTELTRGRPGFL